MSHLYQDAIEGQLNVDAADDITLAVIKHGHVDARKSAYPPIQEQLDMLWHGMDSDIDKRIEPFYSTIKQIKEQFPKL